MALASHCDFVNKFVLGDLIYGTTFDRGDYIEAATNKLNNADAKVTIDRLTRDLDTALRGWSQYAGKITEDQFNALPQSSQQFLLYAQKCGPLWAKMRGNNVNDFTKNHVAKAMPGLGGRKLWSTAYMRAKCKAGIRFVLASGYTVHFAVDSLWTSDKMETIARKETDQPWHTGSELRWLYKNREDAQVKDRVVFYVNGWVRQAPWVEWPNSWASYGATRMDKIPDEFKEY